MVQTPLFGDAENSFEDPVHRAWLFHQREALLDFHQPNVLLPTGGYAWLDTNGNPVPSQGAQLWVGARMIHVFALAAVLGRPGAAAVVEHGLDFYVDGPGHDADHGAWFPTVGGEHPDDRKELYGIAQMLLAGSTATAAGFSRGRALMDEALEIIDRYFWLEEWGRCAEGYDRAFQTLDPYRGQNANMHLTEAYLAAHEVTGIADYLDRARRIAWAIASPAAQPEPAGTWRLVEHFTDAWEPLRTYNLDDKRHPFRPYGSQPGHWLEWSKLLMQLAAQGITDPWVKPAARALFRGAVADAWRPAGGFAYTVDWDGAPVVPESYFWEAPEAMGAAHLLWVDTRDPFYLDWYRTIWRYVDQHFIDHEHGGWHAELDSGNHPVTYTWDGKPDVYHEYQATLYAFVPPELGLATWAATQTPALG